LENAKLGPTGKMLACTYHINMILGSRSEHPPWLQRALLTYHINMILGSRNELPVYVTTPVHAKPNFTTCLKMQARLSSERKRKL
jgi:hypothetical protein